MPMPRFGFRYYYVALALLLVVLLVISAATGAYEISYRQIGSYLGDLFGMSPSEPIDRLRQSVFFQIRLPRVLLGALVGCALSVSGAMMQALFRNPIVEPGLIGTSSGAALGASIIFVLGKSLTGLSDTVIGAIILPFFAFVGALAATAIVYRFAAAPGRVSVATMLLAGIAINAMAAGGTGILSYIARDPQARSITFWSLGTFSGADWNACAVVGAVTIPAVLVALRASKGLNALLLGETDALNVGVDVERLKSGVLLLNTLIVAVATSMVGVIAFVGLVVPHLLRLIRSSDNRFLTIGSALLGASLMVAADMIARVAIAPAELPIGIITAFVGAPVFLWILRSMRNSNLSGGFYA